MMEEETVRVLEKCSPGEQVPLLSENAVDPMEGEQTWPTEEELQEAEGILHVTYVHQTNLDIGGCN